MPSELQMLLKRAEAIHSPPRGYCNQAEAARYLGKSVETLRRRHAFGRGPKRIRNGRCWKYSYADLDAWLTVQADEEAA